MHFYLRCAGDVVYYEMVIETFKNYLEPRCILIGVFGNVGFDVFRMHPFPICYFIGVDFRRFIEGPDHHMIVLMFRKPIIKRGLVNE